VLTQRLSTTRRSPRIWHAALFAPHKGDRDRIRLLHLHVLVIVDANDGAELIPNVIQRRQLLLWPTDSDVVGHFSLEQ